MKYFLPAFAIVTTAITPIVEAQTTPPGPNLLDPATSTVGLIVLGIIAVLALAWIILPFLILSGLRDAQREVARLRGESAQHLKEATRLLAEISSLMKQAGEDAEVTHAHLHNIDSEAQHSNQLLQWIGDLEKARS
jgi:hypothetical protein